jgi:hypothetical protein
MRYRIHQPSVIGDRYIEAAEDNLPEIEVPPLARKGDRITKTLAGGQKIIIVLDEDLQHVPASHWEPLDDAAKAQALACGIEFTGEMPDVLSGLEASLADVQSRMNPASMTQMADMMAAAIASAFKLAGIGEHTPAKK